MNVFLGRVSGAGFWGARVAGAACLALFSATDVAGQVAGGGVGGPAGALAVALDTMKLEIVVGEFEAPVIAPVRRPRPAQEQARQGAAVTVEQRGSQVAVRVPSGAESLSEPIHGSGRVRLYLTLPGTSAPVLPDAAGRRGLIGLKLEEGDDAVRLAIDATSLSGYHLETGDNGSTLWLETAAVRNAEPLAQTGTQAATIAAAPDVAVTPASATVQLAAPAASAITTTVVGSSAWANSPQINPLVATARDGRATALALAKGFAIGASATGELAWNGIRAAAGRTASFTRIAATGTSTFTGRSANALAQRLENAGIDAPHPAIPGALLGLIVATVAAWLYVRKNSTSVHATSSTANEAATAGTPQPTRSRPPAPKHAAQSSPALTDSPAVWAARTMAGNGMDAGSIARRTGIARDAAVLLVAGARRNVPDPASSSPSLLAAVAAGPVPVEAII